MKLLTCMVFILSVVVLGACCHRDVVRLEAIPPEIEASVQGAVDGGHRVGIVVGLINPVGRHVYAYGTAVAGQQQPLDADTQFAIGSITKVFTADLLASMSEAGVSSIETPLGSLWPDAIDLADTRLWHLATHTAGLPREIPAQALHDNSVEPLLGLLSTPRSVPTQESYSNAGMALLGMSLAAAQQTSLDVLLDQRVLKPLGLAGTGYDADPQRLAHPHREGKDITAQRPATVTVARGAGGLHSSANDLMTYLEAQLRAVASADRSWAMTHDARGPMGWKVHQQGGIRVVHHGGDGNGYQAFVGFRPDIGVGVVLLSNSSADDELQQIAQHLLIPQVPLPDFDHRPARVLDAATLASYAGRFTISGDPDGNVITLQAGDSGMIYIEHGPQGELIRQSRLYAVAEGRFELREIPVRIVFSGTGDAARIELHAGEQTYLLERT